MLPFARAEGECDDASRFRYATWSSTRSNPLHLSNRTTPVRTPKLRRSGHTALTPTPPPMVLTELHLNSSFSLATSAPWERRRSKWGQEVLRLRMTGHGDLARTSRINRDVLTRISLAVRGDAKIHGPNLVARSVVSDWRNRRPRQTTQFNYQEMR